VRVCSPKYTVDVDDADHPELVLDKLRKGIDALLCEAYDEDALGITRPALHISKQAYLLSMFVYCIVLKEAPEEAVSS
jgi:hypothetical protein